MSRQRLAHSGSPVTGVVHADARRPFGKLQSEGQTPLEKPVQILEKNPVERAIKLFIEQSTAESNARTRNFGTSDFIRHFEQLLKINGIALTEHELTEFLAAVSFTKTKPETEIFTGFFPALVNVSREDVRTIRIPQGTGHAMFGLGNKRDITLVFPDGFVPQSIGADMFYGTLRTDRTGNYLGTGMFGGTIVVTGGVTSCTQLFGLGSNAFSGRIEFTQITVLELLNILMTNRRSLRVSFSGKIPIVCSDGPLVYDDSTKEIFQCATL